MSILTCLKVQIFAFTVANIFFNVYMQVRKKCEKVGLIFKQVQWLGYFVVCVTFYDF